MKKKARAGKASKKRSMKTIIEQAFEDGFLSAMGTYAFRAPDTPVDDVDESTASSANTIDHVPGEISLA